MDKKHPSHSIATRLEATSSLKKHDPEALLIEELVKVVKAALWDHSTLFSGRTPESLRLDIKLNKKTHEVRAVLVIPQYEFTPPPSLEKFDF